MTDKPRPRPRVRLSSSIQTLSDITQRAHVRLIVPRQMPLYARVKSHPRSPGSRGIVGDISAAGLALTPIEGGRHDAPENGQDVWLDLELEGIAASVAGVVVNANARGFAVHYPTAPSDEAQNPALLELLVRLGTWRVELVDAQRQSGKVAARLGHLRLGGDGGLDLRLAPTFWQLVFLEYLVSWSDARGIQTGLLHRVSDAGVPLPMPVPERHPVPWTSLRRMACSVASRCAAALPEHAAALELVTRTAGGAG